MTNKLILLTIVVLFISRPLLGMKEKPFEEKKPFNIRQEEARILLERFTKWKPTNQMERLLKEAFLLNKEVLDAELPNISKNSPSDAVRRCC